MNSPMPENSTISGRRRMISDRERPSIMPLTIALSRPEISG